MPPLCCVPLCSNRGGHKFPKDQKVKEEWIKVIRRATASLESGHRGNIWWSVATTSSPKITTAITLTTVGEKLNQIIWYITHGKITIGFTCMLFYQGFTSAEMTLQHARNTSHRRHITRRFSIPC